MICFTRPDNRLGRTAKAETRHGKHCVKNWATPKGALLHEKGLKMDSTGHRDFTVLPEDFDSAKDTRASTVNCLVATTIKRTVGHSDVSVGIYHARVGTKHYEINEEGAQLIRDFVLGKDEFVLPVLPVVIRLTEMGDDEYDEEEYIVEDDEEDDDWG